MIIIPYGCSSHLRCESSEKDGDGDDDEDADYDDDDGGAGDGDNDGNDENVLVAMSCIICLPIHVLLSLLFFHF